jgi:diguanylate cyclase (GGDEF)-like protein
MKWGVAGDRNGTWWIGVGIVLTLAAVVGREFLPLRSHDLLAPGSHRYFIYGAPSSPQGSRVEWVDERRFHFRCQFEPKDQFSYKACVVSFLLTPDGEPTRGMDLRSFDSLHLDLTYRGNARFVRLAVRTFDPRFSHEDDGNSARMQSINLRAHDVVRPLTIGLSELTVPEWWTAQYDLPRELNKASLENAIAVAIDVPEQLEGPPHELRIRSLKLQGEWIRRDTLYFAVLCAWIAGAAGAVGWRFLELRRQHRRQQLEIDALHRRTERLHAEHAGLRRLATVDELTGVLNRRGIEKSLAADGMRGREVALLVLDIDHFKRINDDHGHDSGDLVIRRVAAVIAENTREQDIVGRWGGEEFVVACIDCPPQHAMVVAEKIRQRIEACSFGLCHHVAVTASVGVAMMGGGDDFPSAFRRADAALYRAKAGGRNCIVFDDAVEEPLERAGACTE